MTNIEEDICKYFKEYYEKDIVIDAKAINFIRSKYGVSLFKIKQLINRAHIDYKLDKAETLSEIKEVLAILIDKGLT